MPSVVNSHKLQRAEGQLKCIMNRWDKMRTYGRGQLSVLSCYTELILEITLSGESQIIEAILFFLSQHNNLYYSLSYNKALTGRWVKIYNGIIIAVADVLGKDTQDEATEAEFVVATMHRSPDSSHFAEPPATFQTALLSKFKYITNSKRAQDVTVLVFKLLEI